MNCPKCQGGTYLADEDAVKVVEAVSPQVLIIKQTYACRACGDRFSRIVAEDIGSRRNQPSEQRPYQPPATLGPLGAPETSVLRMVSMAGERPAHRPQKFESEEEGEKIQFLD